MKNTIEYKGFIGTIGVSDVDQSFGGSIINIKDAHVSFVGRNYKELVEDFHDAVDDYIDYKKKKNEELENQYKGSFNVRVEPEVHRDAVVFAKEHRISLNKLVEISIKEKIYA